LCQDKGTELASQPASPPHAANLGGKQRWRGHSQRVSNRKYQGTERTAKCSPTRTQSNPRQGHNKGHQLDVRNSGQQITGAKFEITPPPAEGKSRLLVGPGAAKLAQADFSTDGLGTDGIVIRNLGDDLILAGGHPRGTLYAVYTFLEDMLGCRWWSSKVSTIPKKSTIVVRGQYVSRSPALSRSPV